MNMGSGLIRVLLGMIVLFYGPCADASKFGSLPVGSRFVALSELPFYDANSKMSDLVIRVKASSGYPLGACVAYPIVPSSAEKLNAGDTLEVTRKSDFVHGLTSVGYSFFMKLNGSFEDELVMECSRPFTAPDFELSDFKNAAAGLFWVSR